VEVFGDRTQGSEGVISSLGTETVPFSEKNQNGSQLTFGTEMVPWLPMRYAVIIGDVVSSRQLAQRAQFQRQLKSAMLPINRRRGRALASPYTVTLGDEFQAVYRDPTLVFADVFTLLARLSPVRVRFSIGVGEIVTPLNSAQAIAMDGSAFHRARAGLEQLKKDHRLLSVRMAEEDPPGMRSPVLAVLSGLVEGWRQKRLQLFAAMLHGEETGQLSRQTGITSRAVNKNIRAADLDQWKLILDDVARGLNDAVKA
jgi:hypothetical protein